MMCPCGHQFDQKGWYASVTSTSVKPCVSRGAVGPEDFKLVEALQVEA